MTKKTISIRSIEQQDAAVISKAFDLQGWNKPVGQYERYYQEQQAGKRTVLVAEYEKTFAGYVTIMWKSGYLPFYEKKIPEVVDFNVLKKFQRMGIGTALMEEVEKRIKEKSDVAGIGVGLIQDYGAAQILYVKRGYVPDGRGIILDNQSLTYGDEVILGDDPILYLTKPL